MRDKKTLLQMIRIARCEQEGEQDLRIQKYYRRDYVTYAMIRNFFMVTIGYGVLLGVVLLYNMDFLLNNLKNLNLRPLLVTIGAGYLFVLALYSVLVYTLRSLRYLRAGRFVRRYYKELKKLKDLQYMEQRAHMQENKEESQEVQ